MTARVKLVSVPVDVLTEAAGLLDREGYGPASMALLACLSASPPAETGEGSVGDYVREYEFRGDGGDYTPNEGERLLIEDALHGWISRTHGDDVRGVSFDGDDVSDAFRAGALSAQPVSPSEGEAQQYHAGRIAEVMDEGDGFWKACSGCQEGVDGYVSARDYPHNKTFRCQPGGGCGECGGLGVIWDNIDYDDMARSILADEVAGASDQSDTERMRAAQVEVELVGSIARAAMQDFDSLESAWPASKRGSRAQNALDSLRDRISGMEECAKDASAALAEKAADQ